jgi:hypothetical protein
VQHGADRKRLAGGVEEERQRLVLVRGAVLRLDQVLASARAEHPAVAGELDRRREQRGPRELAVARVRFGGEAHVAGHADAAARDHCLHERQRLAVAVEEPLRIGARRRGLAAVERLERAVGAAVEQEAAAADARALRFDHTQREHRRDRRVDRAAALAQHRRAGFGGARVGRADEACPDGGRWASGGNGDRGGLGRSGGAGAEQQRDGEGV